MSARANHLSYSLTFWASCPDATMVTAWVTYRSLHVDPTQMTSDNEPQHICQLRGAHALPWGIMRRRGTPMSHVTNIMSWCRCTSRAPAAKLSIP